MIRVRGGFPGRSRRAFIFLLAIVVPAALAVRHWRTAWTVSAREGSPAGYTLVGSWDGADVPSGTFFRPIGVAVAPGGDVYITDARIRVVRLSSSGEFKGAWGHEGRGPGEFGNPVGIAVAPDGFVHVADSGNHRIVMLTAEGRYVTDWVLPDANPDVFSPEQIAVSPDGGTIYATDLASNRILVLRVDRRPTSRWGMHRIVSSSDRRRSSTREKRPVRGTERNQGTV